MKPILEGGQYKMISVGSTAVRKIIESWGPLMGLHGHIHESPGMDRIRVQNNGQLVSVFNPGSEYSYGILEGIIIQLSGNAIKNYMFTKG